MNPLLKFRERVGLTQSDLATITGLTRQSISAIECGMWEHFPKETHLLLKPIAQDEFNYEWPATYELLEARYQTSRVDTRVHTRQTTSIATRSLALSAPQILSAAHRTGQHFFTVWRQRAVGVVSLRQFAKLVAVNPEVVREYEHSKPFGTMPIALREALLDCSVDVERIERLVGQYWSESR